MQATRRLVRMLLVCRFFADSSLTLRMTDADTAMYSRTHKYRPVPGIGPKRAQPQIKYRPVPGIGPKRAQPQIKQRPVPEIL